jgi:N-acetylglucosaminyldiphosphoundecaprenol N-acetyl-beta-D-mannosaminyltransferase
MRETGSPGLEGRRGGQGGTRSVRLFGLSFTPGDAAAVLATAAAMPASRPRMIVTANMDHIISLSESPPFRKAYDGAAARTLDGMPIVWLARRRCDPGARRVTGHDLLAAALAEPWSEGRRLFFVCATSRVGDALVARLVEQGAPPEAIAVIVPPMGFETDEAYGRALAERIRSHGTTLLVMGVGAPRSEIWVDRQGAALGAPVVLSVGEALSVAAGLMARAPVAMQRAGFEWLFRFAHAPRRLFHRYFVRSWRFLGIVMSLDDEPPDGAHRKVEQVHSKS